MNANYVIVQAYKALREYRKIQQIKISISKDWSDGFWRFDMVVFYEQDGKDTNHTFYTRSTDAQCDWSLLVEQAKSWFYLQSIPAQPMNLTV